MRSRLVPGMRPHAARQQKGIYMITRLTVDANGVRVAPYLSVILEFDCGWGYGLFEASRDFGATWQPFAVTNLYSGAEGVRVYVRGRYYANLVGITHLRYTAESTINPPNAVTGTFCTDDMMPSIPVMERTTKQYVPDPPQVLRPTITQIDRSISDVELSTGTVYAFGGPSLYKSTDYGATWTSIAKPWSTDDRSLLPKIGKWLLTGNRAYCGGARCARLPVGCRRGEFRTG